MSVPHLPHALGSVGGVVAGGLSPLPLEEAHRRYREERALALQHVGMRHVALSPVPRLAGVDLAVVQERGHPRLVW